MAYDLVIRNGEVIDGSGTQRFRADVAVRDGVVAEVGRVTERGSRELDAEGHVVTPGFIDGHTHMDAQVFWDPLGTSSCWQGVTTVVMGNTGFTLAPVRPDHPELVVRNLERAEDISPAALAAGIEWSWETFPEYLDAVDRRPKGINYSAYLGHSALRTWVMGERAFTEEASEDELEAMAQALREGLEAGAMGFTTSCDRHHATSDDRPVASRLASWDEVVRLVAVMTETGRGILELAPESAAELSHTPEQADFFDRTRRLALSSGRPVTFGMVPSPWADQMVELVRKTNAEGGTMFGQTHSRGINMITTFRSRTQFDKLPEWSDIRSLPLERQRELLSDDDVVRKLVEAADFGEWKPVIGAEIRKPDYTTLRLFNSAHSDNPLLADVARARGIHPVEMFIRLGLESDFYQMFIQPTVEGAPEEPEVVADLMREPHTVMTFSDSGAHVSQLADSSIQTHLLAHWVRERQDFTLEEAVRMLTSTPAKAWGFSGRGLVQAGFVADLNVFDPERVAAELPTVESDLPGGATRLRQKSVGFLATLVGGEIILENGDATGSLPGRLLRAGV